ncbi:TPA: cytosolic protein, partial [candidate division WOR-3 bacterium]|nr:cytosolic protein [candidate division WOR-3 bacterium]
PLYQDGLDWLEGFAIFINSKVYGGKKSGILGIDLEFDKNKIRYIVNIKSGPNWGNSSQIKKMKSDFLTAMKTLKTSNSKLNVIAVNGCCYGKSKEDLIEGIYYKYCGQTFWKFISNNDNLYLDIIESLGHKAREKNEVFLKEYSKIINKFTLEFSKDFCKKNEIDWKKIVEMNSSDKK